MDVPVHIGFSILQYAKLRMLEFYFDFMLRYVRMWMFVAVGVL